MAPLDLRNLANALPQPPPYQGQSHGHGHGPQGYHRRAVLSPGPATQVSATQFGPPNPTVTIPGQPFYVPQHPHAPYFYQNTLPVQQLPPLPPRANVYYPSTVPANPPVPGMPFYYAPAGPFLGQNSHAQGHVPLGYHGPPDSHQPPDLRTRQPQQWVQEAQPGPPVQPGNGTIKNRQSIVRGPPMKPRQSGHAIWIGNLPPQTDLMSLVHHVCNETEGLESLFLIPKSNCAFANFKDEQCCSAAQRKLHDSRFMAVRLASRLRKSTVEGPAGVTAPTGPAASAPQLGASQDTNISGDDETGGREKGATEATPPASTAEAKEIGHSADDRPPQKDRFFILKSLTVEDLELSVRNNTWATQAHNEERLNSAFKTSDNVYLVFSANKSGEYFGYARMASAINEDPAAAIQFAPSAQSNSEVDLPRVIPTEPTGRTPKGRIVDDSARGTIFWEADRDDKGLEAAPDDDGPGDSAVGGDARSVPSSQEGSGAEPQAWGKPFRLEWLSTTRLPFHRTRGMRNPWNSNREVKIARDGTELEPSVGRRLIGLFNRAQTPALAMGPGAVPLMGPLGVPVYPPPMR